MKYRWIIDGLDCANCAAKVADSVRKIPQITNCELDFMSKTLEFECEDIGEIRDKLEKAIHDVEPDVIISPVKDERYCFTFAGIDCGHCASLIEQKLNQATIISEARVDFVQKTGYICTHDLDGSLKQMDKIFAKKGGSYELIEHDRSYQLKVATDISKSAALQKIAKLPGLDNFHYADLTISYECRRFDHYALHQQIMGLLEQEHIALQQAEHQKAQDEIKKQIYKIIIGSAVVLLSFIFRQYQPYLLMGSYLILGYDVLAKALKNIFKGNLFDENFLMSLASVMAIILQEYLEALAVMLLYQIGEVFQDMAVANSRKSISDLMDIKADSATVLRDDQEITMFCEDVRIGDIILIKPGQKVPLDGKIIEGSSALDTASLTGEAMYKDVSVGDEIISGCVNVNGALKVQVTHSFAQSTVNKILDLVEHAGGAKAKTERFITRFAKVYTPIVVFMALGIVVVLPLLDIISLTDAIQRACAFLVMSCPCALVISVPLGFFSSIGGLSRRGILIKGSNILEQLANLQAVVFDKTGTLTTGKFYVAKVIGDESGVELAALAESYSTHPIAQSIMAYYGQEVDKKKVSNVEELAGEGLTVQTVCGKIIVGNERLMKRFSIDHPIVADSGTIVYVGRDDKFVCALVIKDQLKENSQQTIKQLKAANILTMMVSGDVDKNVQEVAQKLAVDKAIGQCLPADKVKIVKELSQKKITAFVGDGINDAPVLAVANVGFAMGALGSEAAIEASDVVIMDDDLGKVITASQKARKCLFIAKQNIIFAIGIKLFVLLLGLFGFVNMWLAIFADVGVAMICIVNATRSYR